MKVTLSSITEPAIKFDGDGSDVKFSPEEFISYIARVSNPDNQMNVLTAKKLIRYLIEHKHWSPFEFVDITFKIETRRSISAQIIRHRSFVFQEFSLRYSNAPNIDVIELRKQSNKNRQSSTDVIHDEELLKKVRGHSKNTFELYNELLKNGVAREVARDVLPMATNTTLFMKGSVRSWIHYIELRTEEGTQKEHREIAEAIKKIFCEKFPTISSVMGWANE